VDEDRHILGAVAADGQWYQRQGPVRDGELDRNVRVQPGLFTVVFPVPDLLHPVWVQALRRVDGAPAHPALERLHLERILQWAHIRRLYNTFTNVNGSVRDANGVDTGSVVYRPLPARSGQVALDGLALGLATSLDYSVRVFATRDGTVIGQASSSSFLEFDDGIAPGGATVNDFSIVPGGGSVVATNSYDATGALTGSSLQGYNPATGEYGTTFASDTSGQNAYYLYGADPGLGRTVAVEHSWLGTAQDVQIYDSASGQRLADQPIDAATQYSLFGGRVDPVRHRAVLLGRAAGTRADTLLPVDIGTGALGTPLDVDTGTSRGIYTALDIDNSTGQVMVAQSMPGDLCVIRQAQVTTADLDTGTVAPPATAGRCLTGVAADQAGQNAYLTFGPLFSYPNLVNNNAMSAVGVYDLTTGKRVSLSADFNFVAAGIGGAGWFTTNERGIQIAPATRTAWTYGPGDQQIQQFKY
jgi:hypothetical protein